MTITKTFAAALMASTLLAAPSFAQSNPPAPAAPMAKPATPAPSMNQAAGDAWRGSKFVGLNVYNANNEKIGDINELLLSKDGQIDRVVIGVGGFLGVGEHNVAMKWNEVKFVSEPVKSASTSSTTTSRNTVGSGAATTTRTTARDYPDHAMVNATKDQLKAMPAFKYPSDTK
jgi:hypothetical protein